jgi:hypothetical protein
MALRGEFYGSTNNAFIKPKITWEAVQCPEENCSLVTATLTYSRTNTGFTTSGTWVGELKIGTGGKSESRYVSITYASNTVAITHTARVDHDAYGCAKIELSATGSIPGTTLENTAISQSIELDTIALASSIGATDGYVEAVCMVTVSRKNAAYTHTIALSCNGYEGFLTSGGALAAAPQKIADTVIAFQVPALFYDLMPDSPTAQVELTCLTYNGDIQVGLPQRAVFTITAKESLCAPYVALTARDINPDTLALTGDEGTLVRYASCAECTVQAQGQNGATIVSATIDGVQTDGLQIDRVERNIFTAAATDSRGYITQTQRTLPMVPYIPLTVNATAKRLDPTSGRVVISLWGNYFDGSFGAQDNTLNLTCSCLGQQVQLQPVISRGTYEAQVTLEGLDYSSFHFLAVTAKDAVMQVQTDVAVKPGIPVFDWGQNDFAFHVPVHANAGLQVAGKALWEHIYPVGAVYISANETDPGELFGGAWEQLKDRFLLAAGDVYGAGSRGGEAEHTLTVDEIPSHEHNVPVYWKGASGNSSVNVQGMESSDPRQYTSWTNNTDAAGGGEPHNNMPPYLAVYMWKRIA